MKTGQVVVRDVAALPQAVATLQAIVPLVPMKRTWLLGKYIPPARLIPAVPAMFTAGLLTLFVVARTSR